MLCSDMYRDYEADYSATSSAEEVELQVEEEGWKQREADEEEGSGNLFTSAQHAFDLLPALILFVLTPNCKAWHNFIAPGGFSLHTSSLKFHFQRPPLPSFGESQFS